MIFFLGNQLHEGTDLVARENVNDEHHHLLHLNSNVSVVLRLHRHHHQVGLKDGKHSYSIPEIII